VSRWLWESICGERGQRDLCWNTGFSVTLDKVEEAENVR
jgi:hypothetical protein